MPFGIYLNNLLHGDLEQLGSTSGHIAHFATLETAYHRRGHRRALERIRASPASSITYCRCLTGPFAGYLLRVTVKQVSRPAPASDGACW